MTATLAMMTALGPLSTDMYLPSLPSIERSLGAGVPQVQLTLSLFLVGFAVGQIVYGPFSDRLGRRPMLLAGFAIFLAATLACAVAPSIEVLMAARILQAIGAAGPIVLARAIVRDLYEGARAGRELSLMGSIMGLMPAVAPVFGGLLQAAFGWRANFVAMALLAACILGVTARLLPETLQTRRPEPVSAAAILGDFRVLLEHGPFRIYMALIALAFGGLFAFISVSSFILQDVDGLSGVGFGAAFGATAIAYISGTLLAQRLVPRRGLDGTIAVGVACLAVGSLAQLAGVLLAPHAWAVIVLPMMVYLCGIGLVMPQALAAAMTPFPTRAGAASSLVGLVQNVFAGTVGVIVGHALGGSALPLPIATSLLGCGALALFVVGRPRAKAGRT
jgi:DHA1 family bicyclomycin/chloramphenicol resistance-like MFS transporter